MSTFIYTNSLTNISLLFKSPLYVQSLFWFQDAERIIQKLLSHSWLRLSSDEVHVRLGTRFLAEMETYLRENYRDDLQNCHYCNKIVIRVK